MKTHAPTPTLRKQVEELTGLGFTQEQICKVVGITRPSLAKYYRDELDLGLLKANSAIAGKLYELCMKDNVTAIIFWLKTRAGWKVPTEQGVNGDVKINTLVDASPGETYDEWIARTQKKCE